MELYLCSSIIAIIFSLMCWAKATTQLNEGKPLTVTLDARWSHTPFHLEAAEYFAEEGTDSFWKFVTDLQTLDLYSFANSSEENQYDSIVELASRQLSTGQLSLFKMSLALRVYSPVVEAFRQIGREKHLLKCDFVLEFPGHVFTCKLDELDLFIDKSETSDLDTYGVDHEFEVSAKGVPVILYGDMGSPHFIRWHNAMLKRHAAGRIRYILRHHAQEFKYRKVRLGGYGVELALKSMEYKSQDDGSYKVVKETALSSNENSQNDNEDASVDIAYMKDEELTNLEESDLVDLNLKLVARVLRAPVEKQLRLFRDLVHNFPSIARYIAMQPSIHDNDLRNAIDRNKRYFQGYLNLEPADTALFINGLYYDLEVSDMFVLIDSIKQETKLLEGLRDTGVTAEAIPKLMKLDINAKNIVYGIDIRDSAIQYVNDIETDSAYRAWPRSLQEMLRPTYPGMLRSVRRNMYHLVIVGDPASIEARDIFKFAESFYIHRAPVRVGLVLAVNQSKEATGFTDGGLALLNAFNFISQEKKPFDGLAFITEVYAAQSDTGYVLPDTVVKLFKAKFPSEDVDVVFGADSDYDTGRLLAWDFIQRTGIGKLPAAMVNGILLKRDNLKGNVFEEAVLTEIMKQTPKIQRAIYKGELADEDSVIDFIMMQENIMPRLNERILSFSENKEKMKVTYVDFTGRTTALSIATVNQLTAGDFGASFAASLRYLSSNGKDTQAHALSMWLVLDLDTEIGRRFLTYGLEHIANSDYTRLAIIYNNKAEKGPGELTGLVESSLQMQDTANARQFLVKVLRNWDRIENKKVNATDFLSDKENFKVMGNSEVAEKLKIHRSFVQRFLRMDSGLRGIVVNGKLLGPFEVSESFITEDFNLLERHSMATFGEKVQKVLSEKSVFKSELTLKVSSVLQKYVQSKLRHDVKFATDRSGVIIVPPADKDGVAHDLIAIVDPVSRGAQKLAQMLILLHKVVNARIRVFFNCVAWTGNQNSGDKGLPLKAYYRFVGSPEPLFGSGGELIGPRASFIGLPTKPVLTLAMNTPENWLIGAVSSVYDLDNIRIADVASRVSAEFELEHLLVEGHCFETGSGSPPRGLELTLGLYSLPVTYDTIVMANLGYFQLKANPGTWLLRIRQSRSSELYSIASTENTEKLGDEVGVFVTNFRSKVLKVRVEKRPGKEHEELLAETSSDTAPDTWSSLLNTDSYSNRTDTEDDVINVFSVATGHLYERLLRIMMLSVLKNTQTKVKFWFLKNYLSPSMKDILPYYAEKYGFEFQLVEYKWPRWLNQQTEKQRIIWGYKILFLDVLFPLSVKKIIFVDADQIVRADLKELRDLDLNGAPYGYTPFCDSREDMEGFRFWKRGYWAQHLGHRKYHISALYVVDLMKFRRIAAGDRLRGQYQGLSQDPNSLSNLDQDLPNNMIHQVYIKSLPQEWLWCETWCSDDTKPSAKTIDLCNNPKTKEPKLVAAARIVPEWTAYDDELKIMIEEFQANRFSKEGDEHNFARLHEKQAGIVGQRASDSVNEQIKDRGDRVPQISHSDHENSVYHSEL